MWLGPVGQARSATPPKPSASPVKAVRVSRWPHAARSNRLFDRAACGQRLTRTALTGLALGFGGVALLAWPTGPSHIDVAGGLVLLVAGAGWAAGSLYSRRAPLPRRQFVSAGMQMITGGVMLAIVAAATGEVTQIHRPSTESILALVYLIVIGSWL